MEVDGKTISGNATIARYMAEKHSACIPNYTCSNQHMHQYRKYNI